MSSVDPTEYSVVIAWLVTVLVFLIASYDLFKVYASRSITTLGELPNGGYGWESDTNREISRNQASLLAIVVMMVMPWMLAESSGTPVAAIVCFDIFLGVHAVSMMLPKRYAVTRTTLFADGFEISWERLRYVPWDGGNRIVLQRKGWGRFAPLPLGGNLHDLEKVAARLESLPTGEWHLFEGKDGEE